MTQISYRRTLDIDVAGLGPAAINMPQDASYGDTRTVLYKGKAVAVFGVNLVCKGVGHCWVAPLSDDIGHREALVMVRAGRDLCQQAMSVYGLHRMQTVTEQDARLIKWLELVGFEPESVMERAASDGSNLWMWRRLRSD